MQIKIWQNTNVRMNNAKLIWKFEIISVYLNQIKNK